LAKTFSNHLFHFIKQDRQKRSAFTQKEQKRQIEAAVKHKDSKTERWKDGQTDRQKETLEL